MGWTDDRVANLKKLWLDGLSASQIAKQLGGVTRNAVIGKVHRLGLSGRAAPSQPSRPAFRAAYTVEGRELCVGGLSFGTTRTATILAGLPAADGRTLKRAETVPVDFADRPPFVGFKGTGVILPRENADGLPIETVNVDKVRVTVQRINDRALVFKNINAGTTTGEGQWSWLWGPDSAEDVGLLRSSPTCFRSSRRRLIWSSSSSSSSSHWFKSASLLEQSKR